MKYWELSTVCDDQPDLFDRFDHRPEWRHYAQWHRDEAALVEAQDRDKLDAVLPDEFLRIRPRGDA